MARPSAGTNGRTMGPMNPAKRQGQQPPPKGANQGKKRARNAHFMGADGKTPAYP